MLSLPDKDNLFVEITLHESLSHPNCIRYYDCLRKGTMIYLLLEYASNGCVFFYIDSRTGLPLPLALRFFYQTALAIQYLHHRGIIHRDLKPENLLFDEKYNVKLCDFGWSCEALKDDVRTSVCGTYEYMSPEVVFERRHDFKVDIWCLGILLYEFLVGALNRESAFQGRELEPDHPRAADQGHRLRLVARPRRGRPA